MMRPHTPTGFCPSCGYRLDPGRCPECGRQVDRPLRSHPRKRRLIRRIELAAVAAATLAGGVAAYHYSFEIGRYAIPRPLLLAVSRGDHAIAEWARNALYAQYYDRAAIEWPKADEREQQIDAELSEPDLPDWAGQYGAMQSDPFSGTSGRVIKLAPRSGFTYRWKGCNAEINHGSIVEADSSRIVLDAVLKPKDYAGDEPWPREYLRVIHDRRVYLVAATDMIAFCNTINAGRGITYVGYMQQQGARAAPLSGETQLAQEYSSFVLKRPIEAVLEAVLATREYFDDDLHEPHRAVTARLSPGADRGVFKGMVLYSVDEGGTGDPWVEVVEVAATDCAATLTFRRPGDGAAWPVVSPGWRFSSLDLNRDIWTAAEAPPDDATLTPPPSSGPSPERSDR